MGEPGLGPGLARSRGETLGWLPHLLGSRVEPIASVAASVKCKDRWRGPEQIPEQQAGGPANESQLVLMGVLLPPHQMFM